MSEPLGTLVSNVDLQSNPLENELVLEAWQAASHAACYRSEFPVGSCVNAENGDGDKRSFSGCNVENRFFPATICAERNAVTTAIANGYRMLKHVAIACTKIPGGNSCGLCRQVLTEWGPQAIVLSIADSDLNVRRFQVSELLPAAAAAIETHSSLEPNERRLVKRILKRKATAHAPYSGQASAAAFIAHNAGGHSKFFYGVTDDNASYGGSTNAEVAAMVAARSNGYCSRVKLAVNCTRDITGANPIDGESLQKLREFGPDAEILLINDEGDLVRTSLAELLPDSFGPHSI